MYIHCVYVYVYNYDVQAKTRVKLNFLEHLAKFWELQVTLVTFMCMVLNCDKLSYSTYMYVSIFDVLTIAMCVKYK